MDNVQNKKPKKKNLVSIHRVLLLSILKKRRTCGTM